MSNVSFINRRDLDFLLHDVFPQDELYDTDYFGHCDQQMASMFVDTAMSIARDVFWPASIEIDADEARLVDGKVYTPQVTKDCLDAFRDAGFFGLLGDHEQGGLQLPITLQQAIMSVFNCSSSCVTNFAGLTMSNANMLNEHGSDALKNKYLPNMIAGKWFGTMCLSEPQAGSGLADITTMATPTDEDYYSIKGSKMWISGGDNDFSENIIHMVLAKTPGAPPGTKGISLFLVPKSRVEDDGSIGEFNNVSLIGINHKLGHRGTTNTLLNFGEQGECRGWLVGELHNGLGNMFFMMNEARIAIGMLAVMLGIGGFNYSLDYAKNRPQGRKIEDKDPTSPPVMIVEHADVKRLLLAQKAYAEGGMALGFYCCMLVDRQKAGIGNSEEADLLLELLTPVMKSWPSEFCLEANKYAIQVLGGYGYTREYEVERMYRDNRLNPIHEGTHAIHGIDLLGRKLRMKNGAALSLLEHEITKTLEQANNYSDLSEFCVSLKAALGQVAETINTVYGCRDIELQLANATGFLDAFGHVIIAWQWLNQSVVIKKLTSENPEKSEDAFYLGKLAACQYFFRYELIKIKPILELVASLDDTCSSLDVVCFSGER